MRIRVAFADTDAMGIVHHANYLRYFEIARVEWLREKGLDYKLFQAKNLHLPLFESQCTYKKPARFDDVLEIKVSCEIKGIRIKVMYEVINAETSELIATGVTQHVFVNSKMKVMPLPPEVNNLLGGLIG